MTGISFKIKGVPYTIEVPDDIMKEIKWISSRYPIKPEQICKKALSETILRDENPSVFLEYIKHYIGNRSYVRDFPRI